MTTTSPCWPCAATNRHGRLWATRGRPGTGRFRQGMLSTGATVRTLVGMNSHEPSTGHEHHLTDEEAAATFEPSSWEERYAGDGDDSERKPQPAAGRRSARADPGYGAGRRLRRGRRRDSAGPARLAGHRRRLRRQRAGPRRPTRRGGRGRRPLRLVAGGTPGRSRPAVDPTTWSRPTSCTHRTAGWSRSPCRLSEAVAPGGHLLVVGHAPSEALAQPSESHRRAMFVAEDLLPALPDDFVALVVEQRPRTMTRDGTTMDVHDSTLLARRDAAGVRA